MPILLRRIRMLAMLLCFFVRTQATTQFIIPYADERLEKSA